MGGDLGRLEGRPHPKFEVGGRPMHPSPNILRSSVVGCTGKYEKSKERCFSCEERVLYDISHSKDTEDLVNERENQKNLVDDLKKRSPEIVAIKMEFFSENNIIQKSWSVTNCNILRY